jgi:hypothetical protein
MKFALAYRGRGLRGLGDANCPSAEQLAGIIDPSDPCQAANAAEGAAPLSTSIAPTTIDASLTCLPAGSLGPLAPGQVWCATGTAAAPAGNPSATVTTSYTGLIIAASVLVGLGLLMSGGRR